MNRDELKELNFLIGDWRTEGEVMPTSKSGGMKIRGTDTYEWALGETFILHRVNVMIGETHTEVHEFIGEYNEQEKIFQMRSFDSGGQFTTMQASVQESNLAINGPGMRSKLLASSDGRTLEAFWELAEDGNWKPWMALKLTRV